MKSNGGEKKRRTPCLQSVEMYFSGTQAMIYLQTKVLLHSLFQGKKKKKKEVKQRDNITRFEGIAFHPCGPRAEICRYTKIHHTKEEEENTFFISSRISLK